MTELSVAPGDSPAASRPPGASPGRARASILSRDGRTSYSAASNANGNIALWRPPLRSADADIMRDADKVRARARDLERNHPYAQQAVRASRIGVIGKRLRYSCRPDHRFLGIDAEVAMRWAQEFERVWENYAHGIGFWVDAGRRLTFTQHMALAHDRDFVDGESLITVEWAPERKWRTCFQAVDVDRLSNPHGRPETPLLKGGVALDNLSAPVSYHIRDGHPGDLALLGSQHMTWSEVRRETAWGRPIVLHTYDVQRPGQTRGISQFASVISPMKMGQEYTETALQQAVLQSSYAAVLISQQNYKEALDLIAGMSPDQQVSISDLAEENLIAAMEHHERIKLRFNGAQIPVLWPGEDLKMVTPATGAAALGDFQSQATRSYAAGTGTDPITVSQDYSNVNYSSAKMAAASAYRAYEARRERLISGVAMPMVACFLEEVVSSGELPLPKGVARGDFYHARDALIRGTFLTQGAPMLDPIKERQGQLLGLATGAITLQDIVAEDGHDYIDKLDQQAREQVEREDRGLPPLPLPKGLNASSQDDASDDKARKDD